MRLDVRRRPHGVAGSGAVFDEAGGDRVSLLTMEEPSTPASREQLLAGIEPTSVAGHHTLLRDIFRAEIDDRHNIGSGEFFENLYWCAFLLYLIGDPSDVPMMWHAKHLDFDTACGFDVQFLLGAGPQRTLAYLSEHGYDDIVEGLSAYPELNEDVREWRTFRQNYFYPAMS